MKKMYEVYLEAAYGSTAITKGAKTIYKYAEIKPETIASKVKGSLKSGLKMKAAFLGLKGALEVAKLATSKARRQCASYHGPGKERCILNATIQVNQKKISDLRSLIPKCNESEYPETCKHKINISIRLAQMDIEDAKEKLEEYKRELERESLEVQQEILPIVAGAAIATGAKALASMGAGILIGAVVDKFLIGAWRSAQAIADEAVRKCGPFESGPKKDLCVSKLRLQSYQKKLQVLNKVIGTCPKQKDPVKCREKLTAEIEKLKEKIQIEEDNVTLYNKAAVRAAATNMMMKR